jgi:hypothetical protein
MNNFRMQKLAQLRGIVKTAFGKDEVADAIAQIKAATTLEELEALHAEAEAKKDSWEAKLLSDEQKASMQAAYDVKKEELTAAAAAGGVATTAPTTSPATTTQTTGGAATNPTANTAGATATTGAQMAGQKYIDVYGPELDGKTVQELIQVIITDSNELGTSDSGGIFLIEAAGYYLGLSGSNTIYIWDQIKTIMNGSYRYSLSKISDDETFVKWLNNEETGLAQKFADAFTAGLKDGGSPVVSGGSSGGNSGSGSSSAGASGGGSRSGSKGSNDKTAVIKKELWGTTVSDSTYKYTISDDGKSFNWVSAVKSGMHSQGDSNWGKMVDNLNLIPPTGETRRTTKSTPATPAATTAPVTPAATGLDQSLIQKVAAVLQKASLYALNVRSIQNEKDQIRTLSGQLKGLMGLAAIIVSKVGGSLATLSGATLADINSSTQKELAVNKGGRFSGDVGIILRQVNELSKIGNRSPESLAQMAKSLTMAPATPAAAVTASASLDKKFIKAATLRRMRVRSQMEAAIDSSAQMGRSRVF